MSWVAVGVAGATLVGGVMQSDAAKDASGQQVSATDRSIAAQNQQLGMTRADNAPFLKSGTAANSRLAALTGLGRKQSVATQGPISREEFDASAYLAANPDLASQAGDAHFVQDPYSHYLEYGMKEGRHGFKMGDFQDQAPLEESPLLSKFSAADMEADPVYQSGLKFGLDRGTEGINSRAVAGGMYDSGATLKALTQFGNDYGSTKANESYNRFTNDQGNIYNKLAGISGTGQVATGQVGAAGANATNSIGASLEGAGNARAAGIVGGANAWGNVAAGVGNAANNYQSNKTLQALLEEQKKRNSGSGGGVSSYDYGPE